MKRRRFYAPLIALASALHAFDAGAVCLDPVTLVSGYKIPLSLEVRTADAIVIGRVLSEQVLKDSRAQPVF